MKAVELLTGYKHENEKVIQRYIGFFLVVISWNLKHVVNIKTIRGVRTITNLEGYKPIEIWSPSVLLESEE